MPSKVKLELRKRREEIAESERRFVRLIHGIGNGLVALIILSLLSFFIYYFYLGFQFESTSAIARSQFVEVKIYQREKTSSGVWVEKHRSTEFLSLDEKNFYENSRETIWTRFEVQGEIVPYPSRKRLALNTRYSPVYYRSDPKPEIRMQKFEGIELPILGLLMIAFIWSIQWWKPKLFPPKPNPPKPEVNQTEALRNMSQKKRARLKKQGKLQPSK